MSTNFNYYGYRVFLFNFITNTYFMWTHGIIFGWDEIFILSVPMNDISFVCEFFSNNIFYLFLNLPQVFQKQTKKLNTYFSLNENFRKVF